MRNMKKDQEFGETYLGMLCARNLCDVIIKRPKGFLVYNPISQVVSKEAVGSMLICPKCARKIFSPKAAEIVEGPWSNNVWKMTERDLSRYIQGRLQGFSIQLRSAGITTMEDAQRDPVIYEEVLRQIDEIGTLGIVQRMRKKNQSMKEAKKEARRLAELWWDHPKKVEKDISRTITKSWWK